MATETAEPSRARVALTGALHGLGAFLVCALALCALAAGLAAGAKGLSLPAVLAVLVFFSFQHFGVFALPIAAGIGALVASLGQPKRAARRAWLTVFPLTVVFPIIFFATATMRLA